MLRTKFTSGPPVTNRVTVGGNTEYKRSSTDKNVRVTHYKHKGAVKPILTTYEDTEEHLFAVPSLFIEDDDEMLKIGARYTDTQLANKIAAAAAAVGKKPVLGESGVRHRIRRALVAKAKERNTTVAEQTMTFKAARKANGVPVRAARKPRAKKAQLPKAEPTEQKLPTSRGGEFKRQSAAHKNDFGGEGAANNMSDVEDSDISEMTELETDDEA